ncbi:hypothetical protein SK128_024094 [Halocaridina rubra]|uniref:Centrosomal protein of 192 kDa n=1 Tax=Halocaridina rubra TaxID=373956 RepID=A0AAN9ADH4_HALRR
MSKSRKSSLDDTKESVVASYGSNPYEEETSFDLGIPQAASTAATKKSREDFLQEYMRGLVDIDEIGSADEQESDGVTPTHCETTKVSMQKMTEPAEQNQMLTNRISGRVSRGSEDLGKLTSLSLINVDSMSDLSSSRFLVDHTQKVTRLSINESATDKEKNFRPVPREMNDSGGGKYGTKSISEGVAQIELDMKSHLCQHSESELSQGEGEKLRVAEASVLEEEKEVKAGLPSFFLEPQNSLMMDSHLFQDRSIDCGLSLSERFGQKLKFVTEDSVALSIIYKADLENSKLFSTSCNSLGSFGKDERDDLEEKIPDQPSNADIDMNPFMAEQKEMECFLNENFHAIDLDFFDEEEKEYARKNPFIQEELCSGGSSEFSLSGIYEITQVTVRPSWITSSEKEVLHPGTKFKLDDFIRLRSNPLGSLGGNESEEKIDFGLGELDSPPKVDREVHLLEMSAVNDQSHSYLQAEEHLLDDENDCQHQPSAVISNACNTSSSYTLSDYSTTLELQTSSSGCSSSGSTTFQVSPRNDSRGAIPKQVPQNLSKSQNVEFSVNNGNQPCGISSVFSAAKNPNVMKTSEKALNQTAIGNAEHLKNLLYEALRSDDPEVFLRKMFCTSQKLPDVDTSELDASREVLQLRGIKEALKNKKEKALDKVSIQDFSSGSWSKKSKYPAATAVVTDVNNDAKLSVNRYMDKLTVQRTGSAPGTYSYIEPEKDVMFTESVLDDSVRGFHYEPRLFENLQKSQVESLADTTNRGIDISTPCVPRGSSSNHGQPSAQYSICVKNGKQLHFEDRRPSSSIPSQRPLPRMGLASTLVGTSHGKWIQPFANGSQRLIEKGENFEPESTVELQSSKSETSISHISDDESFSEATDKEALRSSSVPSGLQVLGFPGHSQIVPSCSSNVGDRNVLPQFFKFNNSCILGIASEDKLTFRNLKKRWVQLTIRLLRETINKSPATTTALFFKEYHFVEPKSTCDINLNVCGQMAGLVEAVLEVKVSDLVAGDRSTESFTNMSVHTVIVSAKIEEPKIRLICEREQVIDFGIIPESCIMSQEVTVLNYSPQPIPIVLALRQVAATSPVFYWEVEETESLKIVSTTHLACELPSANIELGPIPKKVQVYMKAPRLDKVRVNENGIVQVGSRLQVILDTPSQATYLIASVPIEACIGALCLMTDPPVEPIVMETTSLSSCSASIPLKNNSTFPIRLSLEPNEHRGQFSVNPSLIVIQAYALVSVTVTFTPKGKIGKIESTLSVKLEPKGMVYSFSLIGVSQAQASEVMVPSLPVHRTLSAPLESQVDKSKALECSRSYVAFGAVPLGEEAWQKLVLRNSVTQFLPLIVRVIGSPAFAICEAGKNERKIKMDITLGPCQEFVLSVFFKPNSVEALNATMILRPCDVLDHIKFKIPLQGYGGHSKLHFLDSCQRNSILVRGISPQNPGTFLASVLNVGDREMFLKFLIFQDKTCTEFVPETDIHVQPANLILRPNERYEVIILVKGTPSNIAKLPGCIGILKVITGEEILRRRFKKHVNVEIQTKHLNDPSLLKYNWKNVFVGENDSLSEEMGHPLRPCDKKLFYNSCSKFQFEIYGERDATNEASSTAFLCLDAEETTSATEDFSILTERHSPPSQLLKRDVRISGAERAPLQPLPQSSRPWNVFPLSLSISAMDTSTHTLYVVNFTDKMQMLEVSSAAQWLRIHPQEAALGESSSVEIGVRLLHSKLPQPIHGCIVESLHIMCENECLTATITVTPENFGSYKKTGSADLVPSVIVTPPSTSEGDHHIGSEASSQTIRAAPSSNTRSRSAASLARDYDKKIDNPKIPNQQSECPVQLVSTSIAYPSTPAGKEYLGKVKLKNLDSIDHTIEAKVTTHSFAIRHHQFVIKAGYFVNVPVYFRPIKPGMYAGCLLFTVLKNGKILTVDLSGKAV